jgi:pimeloyl-ACP methyl ester carboxylesterase
LWSGFCENLTTMNRHHAEIAGRRMSWLQAGQGRAVVLLHAFPVAAEMWKPQLDAVPHGWMMIAPDLPGFGESRGGGPATHVDDHADAVLALMRHLNIEQAAIGGCSMGGYITFALHRKAPQRFRAMILADTRAEADASEAKAGREKMQAAVREKGAAAAADVMLPKLLGANGSGVNPQSIAVREMTLKNEAQGIVDAIEAMKTRPDSTPTLKQIACPALVIVGDQDEVTPIPMAEVMAREIPQATLTVLPGAAHLANLQQPEAFNRALWAFLTP